MNTAESEQQYELIGHVTVCTQCHADLYWMKDYGPEEYRRFTHLLQRWPERYHVDTGDQRPTSCHFCATVLEDVFDLRGVPYAEWIRGAKKKRHHNV